MFSTRRARLGLLMTALVLGAILILTGIVGYLSAKRSSADIARSAASAMGFAVRRELRQTEDDPKVAFELVMEELKQQGLRFIGIVDREGTLQVGSGELSSPIGPVPQGHFLGEPFIENLEAWGRVRVLAPLPFAKGHGGGLRNRAHAPFGTPQLFIVLEIEPIDAQASLRRAVINLSLSLGTSVILLIAAIVFWRLARRADQLSAELNRDQQLKTLGQMSAVLGHELKNPLTSLKGHAQLLLEKLPDDHPGRKGALTVVKEAERLESLSRQVLDFARTGELKVEICDLKEIVRNAVERAQIEPCEITSSEVVGRWMLDQEKIEQVIVNLCQNAREATPSAEPVRIEITEAENSLIIDVLDSGEGIPPGEEDRIFEPFFTTRVKGTGLGLALARQIVEKHGGRISAANREEGGARFRIVLPRIRGGLNV